MKEEAIIPRTRLELVFRNLVNWVMFDSVFGKHQSREGHVLVSGNNQATRKVRFEKTYWQRNLENYFSAKVGYTPAIVLTLYDKYIMVEQHFQFEMENGELKTELNPSGRIGVPVERYDVGFLAEDPNVRLFGAINILTLDEVDLIQSMIDIHLGGPVARPAALMWFKEVRETHLQSRSPA